MLPAAAAANRGCHAELRSTLPAEDFDGPPESHANRARIFRPACPFRFRWNALAPGAEVADGTAGRNWGSPDREGRDPLGNRVVASKHEPKALRELAEGDVPRLRSLTESEDRQRFHTPTRSIAPAGSEPSDPLKDAISDWDKSNGWRALGSDSLRQAPRRGIETRAVP